MAAAKKDSLRVQLLASEITNLVCHLLAHRHLLRCQIFQILATCIQEPCEPQARTIELADDHRCFVAVYRNEISCPQKRNVFLREAERLDVILQLTLQLVLDSFERKFCAVWKI